jgi:hypothetical protein
MPNFTQIGQTVWISIRYEHIYIYIFCALYIRYYSPFFKTSYLNEEVNCTEPPPTVGVLW